MLLRALPLVTFLIISGVGYGQTQKSVTPPAATSAGGSAGTEGLLAKLVTRPTIMVFPFFRENQTVRQVVEDDPHNRVVMTKVKEAFDRRGYSTLDFMARVRNLNLNQALTADTKTDFKSQVIQSSGADIAVEIEYRFAESGSGNEVSVVLNAYESSTGASLSNKVGSSGKFYSQDVAKLVSRATDPILDDFLNVMQQKFTDIVENGRYLSLEFHIAETSDLTMEQPVGTDKLALSDALEAWVSDHTNSYHIQGVSENKAIFDVIRVPRTDPSARPLTTTRYALSILSFCNGLAAVGKPGRTLRAERLVKGNTILITLK
jgi:hypothetical protein